MRGFVTFSRNRASVRTSDCRRCFPGATPEVIEIARPGVTASRREVLPHGRDPEDEQDQNEQPEQAHCPAHPPTCLPSSSTIFFRCCGLGGLAGPRSPNRIDQRAIRSTERRAGKEGVSTCRSRWKPYL